ncbi:MAG: response regulator [Proteobacteria bacterium]|nr:response regulator [Pseudomonadota bacterium]MBU1715590.1 response regulator [Pseudomonadota bacterium]
MKDSTIFIVDDEPYVLSSLKRFFVDEGYSVATFPDGNKALTALAETEVAVIVADYMMPGISGIEVLQKAREISPDTVRVMITGALDLELALEAISRGEVYRIIGKPWRDQELKITISQCVEQYNLIQENYSLQEKIMDQAKVEMVKALVVTLNHEINNSLVFISIGIDKLSRSFAENKIPDNHEEYMKKMKASCNQIASLIKKMRNIEEIKMTEYLSGTIMIDSKASK